MCNPDFHLDCEELLLDGHGDHEDGAGGNEKTLQPRPRPSVGRVQLPSGRWGGPGQINSGGLCDNIRGVRYLWTGGQNTTNTYSTETLISFRDVTCQNVKRCCRRLPEPAVESEAMQRAGPVPYPGHGDPGRVLLDVPVVARPGEAVPPGHAGQQVQHLRSVREEVAGLACRVEQSEEAPQLSRLETVQAQPLHQAQQTLGTAGLQSIVAVGQAAGQVLWPGECSDC